MFVAGPSSWHREPRSPWTHFRSFLKDGSSGKLEYKHPYQFLPNRISEWPVASLLVHPCSPLPRCSPTAVSVGAPGAARSPGHAHHRRRRFCPMHHKRLPPEIRQEQHEAPSLARAPQAATTDGPAAVPSHSARPPAAHQLCPGLLLHLALHPHQLRARSSSRPYAALPRPATAAQSTLPSWQRICSRRHDLV